MEEMTYTVGSENVYADLGYAQPEEMRAKAELVFQLARIIAERGLTQVQAARVLGLPQPKVSALLRGHFAGFSGDTSLASPWSASCGCSSRSTMTWPSSSRPKRQGAAT